MEYLQKLKGSKIKSILALSTGVKDCDFNGLVVSGMLIVECSPMTSSVIIKSEGEFMFANKFQLKSAEDCIVKSVSCSSCDYSSPFNRVIEISLIEDNDGFLEDLCLKIYVGSNES